MGPWFGYFSLTICWSDLQGTKDPSKSSSLENMVQSHAVDMEHENMDSEDYLLKSGLSDDDD